MKMLRKERPLPGPSSGSTREKCLVLLKRPKNTGKSIARMMDSKSREKAVMNMRLKEVMITMTKK